MSENYKGVVKWFDNARGFGFIEREDGRDVFVHYSVIASEGFKTLKDGEDVTYEMSEGDKGLHAVNVRRVNVESEPKSSEILADKIVKESSDSDMTGEVCQPSDESENHKTV